MNLTAPEIRVLGCLLEKQRTTPDAYPLTLNALRLACNQSTNREPVVSYDDEILRDALHRLGRRGFTRLAGASSRSPKFRHLLAEALPLSEDEQATLCVLMLRGAQTPGELKQRTERMHAFADLAGVHETLGRLIERGLVARLERRPGQKEERYAQLLADPDSTSGLPAAATAPAAHAAVAAGAAAPPGFVTPPGSAAPVGPPASPASAVPAASAAPAAGSAVETSTLAELSSRVSRLESQLAELLGESRVGEPRVEESGEERAQP